MKFYKVQYVIEVGNISRIYMNVTDSLIQFIQILIEKGETTKIPPRIVDVTEIEEELYNILKLCPILL